MGLTLINPLLPIPTTTSLTALQWVAFLLSALILTDRWTVAVTTVWSGFSYLGKSGVKILKKPPIS
jgi:cardiolipin synthase